MVNKIINPWANSSVNTTTNSGLFTVSNSSSNTHLHIDNDGDVIIKKLVLLDENGDKWEVKINDGEIVLEPRDIRNKRNHKLKVILNEKTSE
jgi:hypothetical protein